MIINISEISPVSYLPVSFSRDESMQNTPIPFLFNIFFDLSVCSYIHIYIHRLRRNMPISIQIKAKGSCNMISLWMGIVVVGGCKHISIWGYNGVRKEERP